MTITTDQPSIEVRLGIERGAQASRRQEAERLKSGEKLARYKSDHVEGDRIRKQRQKLDAEIDKAELVIEELETRLPHAIAGRLAGEYAAACEAERVESEHLAVLLRKCDAARTVLDACVREYNIQKAKVESTHGATFAIDFKLRQHREKFGDIQ